MNAVEDAPRIESPRRTASWLHQDPLGLFADGMGACLALRIDGGLDVYDVFPVIDAGRITAWTMSKVEPGDNEVVIYTLPGDLSSCSCPWTQYRPNAKPCRHRSALRAALSRLGFTFEE